MVSGKENLTVSGVQKMYPARFRTGYIFIFPLYKMFSCVIIKSENRN